MFREIERKFLVAGDFKAFVCASHRIVQGYMCSDAKRTIHTHQQPHPKIMLLLYHFKPRNLPLLWQNPRKNQNKPPLLILCQRLSLKKKKTISS